MLSPGSFGGEDVRFSTEFEALENELTRAQSIHASGQVDWLKILENSEALLRDQSKDLRVASWFTWALFQRESYAGLLAGISVLRELCEQHWDDVHPAKPVPVPPPSAGWCRASNRRWVPTSPSRSSCRCSSRWSSS
jgi:type VI secretion system protein VasJ